MIATFLDKVRQTDAVAVAERIATQGPRGAIAASTVEIVAMALLMHRLKHACDHNYRMFEIAGRLEAEADPEARGRILLQLELQSSFAGAALEGLGYGQADTLNPTSTPTEKETTHGER